MKTKLLAVFIVAFVLVATVSVAGAAAVQSKRKMSALAYHDTWRKLWEDHIWWTRMVIIGIFDNLGGTGNYTARLLRNYEDMENALRPFYGNKAEELGDLLQAHLLIAAEILLAVKAGQDPSALIAAWYQNANAIAVKMNELNPRFWNLNRAVDMWKVHLDATLEEALAHFNKDWAADVVAFDKVHRLALPMADFFSRGVIRQFPSMFIRIGFFVKG